MTQTNNKPNKSDNPLTNIQFNFGQNFIQYESAPSLQQLTLNKIAITLCENYIAAMPQKGDVPKMPRKGGKKLDPSSITEVTIYEGQKWWEQKVKYIETKVIELPLSIYCKKGLHESVKKIGNELTLFVRPLILTNGLFIKPSQLKKCFPHLHWTVQGTIDCEKSTRSLIDNCTLRTIDKYWLACFYCLKDKVISLESKASKWLKQNQKVEIWESMHCILQSFCEDNDEEMMIEIKMYLAVFINNGIAVQYLMENCASKKIKSKVKAFAELSLTVMSSPNVFCYLLPKMSSQDVEDLCIRHGHVVVKMISNDERWHKYHDIVARYVLTFITKMKFLNAIRTLCICWLKIVPKRYELETVMRDFAVFFYDDLSSTLSSDSIPNLSTDLSEFEKKFLKMILNFGSKEKETYYGELSVKKRKLV